MLGLGLMLNQIAGRGAGTGGGGLEAAYDLDFTTLDNAALTAAGVTLTGTTPSDATGLHIQAGVGTASITGTDFSDWYNQSEGTWVFELELLSIPAAGSAYAIGFSDAGLNHFVGIRLTDVLNQEGKINTSVGEIGVLDMSPPDTFRVVYAYAANDRAVCIDGGAVTTSAAAHTPPAVDRVYFNGLAGDGSYDDADVKCRRFIYYASRVPDADLPGL